MATEPKALATVDAKEKSVSRVANLNPKTFDEAWKLATAISKTSMIPPSYRGHPHDVFIAMQMGQEVGLAPMQSLQSIAVINGRPTLYGDGALAIVQKHPDYEWHTERLIDNGKELYAVCTIKRRGHEEYTVKFSLEDAKIAKLWGKDGPWTSYPKRMLQMRARGFAIRDKFADAMRGLAIAEEAMDIPVVIPRTVEHATLDETALLAPSSEPNRGHGNEGMQKTVAEAIPEPVAESVVPEPTPEPETQPEPSPAPPKGMQRGLVTPLATELKKTRDKREYMVIVLSRPQAPIQCWHRSLWEYMEKAVGKECDVTVKGNPSGGKLYWTLEEIHRIDTCKFVNNQPVGEAGQGTMQPTGDELFPPPPDAE